LHRNIYLLIIEYEKIMKKLFLLCLLSALLMSSFNVIADDGIVLTSSESAYIHRYLADKTLYDSINFNGAGLNSLQVYNSYIVSAENASPKGTARPLPNHGKIAFYKFDLSQFKGKKINVEDANVKITVLRTYNGNSVYNLFLHGYNPAWSADTLTFANMTNEGGTSYDGYTGLITGSYSFQPLDSVNGQRVSEFPTTLTYKASTYLQSVFDADSSYVSFALTMDTFADTAYVSTKAILEINCTTESVSMEIGSSGYCTFGDTAQAYSVPSEAAAYIAALGQSMVKLTQVASITGEDIIPVNTAVVIKGEPNSTITLVATETDKTVADNALHISDPALTGDGSTYYVLGTTAEGTAVFGPLKSGVAMKSNRAYFLSADIPAGAKASRLPIVFNDNHTTGITSAPASDVSGKAKIYNLQGAEVIAPDKGVYISNGKKILK